ncbi:hypothetical protein M378DRAFT_188679 [Amanita muscaria Koide BX008]|uniref:HNH nuclease domain-containing protein n=1 Tax=Amanita muscaria (strain Koide BX008) TaxID=946122 RepID=A0A0C2W2J0_AMAMK|nr:hypothetical protein M378DRAFT_188679 [Amanita muscaria Koide BX008]
MAAIVELQMPIDGEYQPALSIPVETCQRFSVHPLRWLRYVGFTIGTEGHISQSAAGPVVRYSEVDIQAGVYYYIPDSQDPFLLDPDLMDDRTSDSSAISTRRADFAQRVTDRDGSHGTCLMTGATTNFQACHIIPHAKGNQVCSEYLNHSQFSFQAQYMNSLADHRNEVLDPPLDDINDPRNGMLLTVLLHRPFGASVVAFLETPNFAMSVTDVALVMQPIEPNAKHLGFAVSRLTLQHFNAPDAVTTHVAPHNSDARQRMDHDDWPPPLLFDIAYGCAALNTWGVPQFVNLARQRTRHIYYDDDDSGDGGDGEPYVDVSGVDQKRYQQRLDSDARAARREQKKKQASNTKAADSQTPDLPDIILGLWMHNARQGQRQARAMKANKTQEKVRTWLDSTKD